MRQGVAGNLAGGTHHAYADKGSGFCVFNDVAVAARLMQAEWAQPTGRAQPLRVAVIDLDVHQGNGTAHIFRRRPQRVHPVAARRAQLSVPQGGGDLDVDLPDGCGDANTWTRWTMRWTNWSSALSRVWCCTWPAPTRTRATGWGA
jgi:acetoin utilization deacetylase AcuC-like enzyme